MEEISVPEGGAQTEDVVALGMLRNGLHDRPVNDDQMFGRCLHGTTLARVAGIEEQRRTLQAYPIALPAALPRQLDLVLLPQQPLLHTQKSARTKKLFRCLRLKALKNTHKGGYKTA